MQQQQLAAQLAHHGGSRQPPLSPAPHTSDSDSDISLGAHSPPLTSPGPPMTRFGASSPTPLSSFRFGPHSPGPMPPQFRFGTHSPPNFRLERQSPIGSSPGSGFRIDRRLESPNLSSAHRADSSPINVENPTSNFRLDRQSPMTATNTRLDDGDTSPIDVESTASVYRLDKSSPIRLDHSPVRTSLHHHSPPMNLRIADNPMHLGDTLPLRIQPENPIPIRLGSSPQLTTPLRIRVNSPSRLAGNVSPQTQTNLSSMGAPPHGGIVRIAPPSPAPQVLHRPFSPPRLT